MTMYGPIPLKSKPLLVLNGQTIIRRDFARIGIDDKIMIIEELDVLCILAARFKHYFEKPALTEDAF